MHLTLTFLLFVAIACASKNKLNPGNLSLTRFNVTSESEAKELITSRLTYLRHLFRNPGTNTSCINPTSMGDVQTDSDGNLYSISRIYLSGSGNVDCPGPKMRQGNLIFLFCKNDLVVKEFRVKQSWNDHQWELKCTEN